MKNMILALTLVLTLCSFQQTLAQYPIPSYDVSVKGRANFQESQTSRGRRNLNVKVQCGGIALSGTCQATVWVYSLDGQTVLGPYTVNGGETLTVPIDEREWGVYIQTEDIITVAVWVTAEKSLKMERLNGL